MPSTRSFKYIRNLSSESIWNDELVYRVNAILKYYFSVKHEISCFGSSFCFLVVHSSAPGSLWQPSIVLNASQEKQYAYIWLYTYAVGAVTWWDKFFFSFCLCSSNVRSCLVCVRIWPSTTYCTVCIRKTIQYIQNTYIDLHHTVAPRAHQNSTYI